MGEYIQSNDDSGNLALYAGLVAGGLVVGSALAYKASSPKNKSKRGGGGLIVPEKGVSYAKGSSQFALGSVAKALTFGKFGGETANKGIKNMVDSIVTDHFNDNAEHYKKGLNTIKETVDNGMKTLSDDAALAKELVGKGQSDKAIINQILKENPNSMLNPEDLSNIRDKKAAGRGEGLSRDDLEQQYIDAQNERKAKAAKMKERKAIEEADFAGAYDKAYKEHMGGLHDEALAENRAFDVRKENARKAQEPKPVAHTASPTGELMDKTPLRRAEQAALSKEAADVLRLNPNQGVYDVLKQLPSDLAALDGSAGVVQNIQRTAKERAQKNATSSSPNLQERLSYYKDSKRAHKAHMDSLHREANLENVARSHGQLSRSELSNLESRQWQVAGATPYRTRKAHRKPNETDQELARRQNAFNQQARRKRFGGAKPESRFKGTKLLKTLL